MIKQLGKAYYDRRSRGIQSRGHVVVHVRGRYEVWRYERFGPFARVQYGNVCTSERDRDKDVMCQTEQTEVYKTGEIMGT
jgi:hypothetical protein